MQGFLWNAGIGWTIPNRNSCECLPLIKPLSCTNTLHPAQTALRIWFWGIFLSPLWRRHLEGGTSPQLSHPMAFCCRCSPEENTGIICSLLEGYLHSLNLTGMSVFQLMAQCLARRLMFTLFKVIKSVKLLLVKAKLLHDKKFLFPLPACVLLEELSAAQWED